MKEISYIHAEGYPAGESKHGPIALVEDDYPVVFTLPSDKSRDKMMGSVQEMAARGATTVGIIEKGDEEMKETLNHYFEIPVGFSKYCSTIAYIIPQQLLAYYTSVTVGENPDRPRNLAKCFAKFVPVLMNTGEKIPVWKIFEDYKSKGRRIAGESHEEIIELESSLRPKVVSFNEKTYELKVAEVTHLYKSTSDILIEFTTFHYVVQNNPNLTIYSGTQCSTRNFQRHSN